jgi:acyl-CoA thioesterase-1
VSSTLRSYAALLLLVQLAACSDGQAPENAATVTAGNSNSQGTAERKGPAPGEKLVLAFGDSLYAGYGVQQNESFPFELERSLEARGIKAYVHNAGVSGDTTSAGLQRLAFTLDGLPRKPDLAIVGLGGNDMLRGLSPDMTRKNLDAILEEFEKRDIDVMLTGMIAAPNMGPDYAGKFNAIYPELAREYDAPLYPFFLDGVITDASLMLPDRIHPNPAGIDKIVEKVAPVVASALGS